MWFLSSAPLLIVFILPYTSKSSFPRPCAYHIHNFGRRFSSCRRSDSCWCPGCCIPWCSCHFEVIWPKAAKMCDGFTREDIPEEELLLDTGKWIIDTRISFLKVCQNCASLWCNLWGVEESFRDDFLSCQQAGCIGCILTFHKESLKQMTGNDRKM